MMARLTAWLALLALSACSRQYSPDTRADAAQIYREACLECHKPAANGSIFLLAADQATLAYISAKVRYGSWLMPAFPKLSAADLLKISAYALEYSDAADQ